MVVGNGWTMWKAIDETLARPVSILTFAPGFPRIPQVVTAARAASRLTDPRMAQVFDVEDGSGQAYIVLEWVGGDSLTDQEASRAQRAAAPAFFVVTSAFMLAELGDKTMLATITLAADNNWLGVWIGSTIGMVAADALAILVGAVAGKHLPERVIQVVAAALFGVFGIFMVAFLGEPLTWRVAVGGGLVVAGVLVLAT